MRITANYLPLKWKSLGLLLAALGSFLHIHAQEPETNEDEIDLLLDELFFDEAKLYQDITDLIGRKDFVYGSLNYNSQTYFSGRDTGIEQFSLLPQLSYYHKTGLSISASALYFSEFDTNWDLFNLSVSYFTTLGTRQIGYLNGGYSRYFYNNDQGLFTNSADLLLGLRTANKRLGTEISTAFLFGNDEAVQLQLSGYGRLKLISTNTLSLQFRPRIIFLFARQTIALDLASGPGNDQQMTTEEFGLLNTQIKLPLCLYLGDWDFEVSYILNLPNAVSGEGELDSNGFLGFGLGYLLDLR